MVRGDSSCPRLCMVCKIDCLCERPGCGVCHNCNYRMADSDICDDYQHGCERNTMDKTRENLLKFPRLFSSEIVKIIIGKNPPEERFVPKYALIEHAEYFKHYFSFEGQRGSVLDRERASAEGTSAGHELQNSASSVREPLILDTEVDDPDAFNCFIQFAYWDNYNYGSFTDLRLHADVYVLAERLQADKLKDLAVRKASSLIAEFNGGIHSPKAGVFYILNFSDVISTIYLNTSSTTEAPLANEPGMGVSEDPFRRLLALFCGSCFSVFQRIKGFEKCLRTLPDFALDVMSSLQNGRQIKLDGNGYFVHVDEILPVLIDDDMMEAESDSE